MEEQTQTTPISTPETSAPPETTPFDPTVAEPTDAPGGGESEATLAGDAVVSVAAVAPAFGGIITPLAVPMSGGVGEVAAIPCIIDPAGHGYVICRVYADEALPVSITYIPEKCQAEHPLDDAFLTEYGMRARAIVTTAVTQRRQGAPAPSPEIAEAVMATERAVDE